MKPECPERTTDHGQATAKLYHLRLRVEYTLSVIYKAGREPMPSPGTPASSTTKTVRHDIAEILMKVALNTINKSINQSINHIF
jgi:hypothetical protein